MRLRPFGRHAHVALMLFLALTCTNSLLAQSGSGGLRGQVTDPSGAAVAKATVLVITPAGQSLTAKTNGDGVYELKGLAPDTYTVKAIAQGFAVYVHEGVEIIAGQVQRLDVALSIQAQRQEVVVTGQATKVDVNPASNASAVVMTGKDLEALSDDPDELESELQALAGPSAGPNGGQIYIDGFTGSQLPPKSSIREIRINQNPFSAEYDKLGHGRIETLTKSGTDNFHGQFFLSGNSSVFNARNPFAALEPGYQSTQFSGNLSGPLGKKASFFFNAERRNLNGANVVSAFVLDPSFDPVPFSEAVLNPGTRTNISPRIDYHLSKDNTLTVRYEYWRNNESNDGIGQFSLPSQGYNLSNTEQTLQASDTQIFGAKTLNETRFQYIRDRNLQTAQNTQLALSVLGAFTNGGSSFGNIVDNKDRYELQNYSSISLGTHFLKFGGRLRAVRDVNDSTSGFNGTFTFASLTAYQITEKGLQQGLTPAQIRSAGGGASQFTIVTGLPGASVTLFDAGLYAQDDWRLRPNIAFSYGLRFETQDQIQDHVDLAPRVGIAWSIGRGKNPSPKTVIRAGFGMFYDRFTQDLVLQAERLNGTTQQQFVVTSPNFFPNVPPTSMLTSAQTFPTIYQIEPKLHAPYTIQTAVSVERQLSENANVAVSYLNSRGVHMLLSRNINAPRPGTFDPSNPASGVRPLVNIGNIYQYESDGIFKQNQLIANLNFRAASTLSFFGYYVLGYANSDTSGASSFPSNQYDLIADYGRAAFDVRHRVYLGGTIALPHAFRLSPYLVASSGLPFNITVGHDLNGDSIFNDRPAFATSQSNPQNVVTTRWGFFDTVPIPGETIIPPNFGTGPGRFTLNMHFSKTFVRGKKSEGPGASPAGRSGGVHRYSLTFSVYARNIFNNVNLATPIGNLNSPLFGQSNALAGRPYSSSSANRRIDLQVTFNF